MKKILALILALACCLSLFGCKKEANPTPTAAPTTVPTAAPTTAPTQIPTEETAETEAPTAAPTQVPTEAPSETEKPTAKPTKAPTEKPTQASTTAATTAPTKKPVAVVTVTKIPTVTTTKAPTTKPTAEPTKAPTQAPTETPTEAPTEAPHQHTFGEWVLQAASTCKLEGREERHCDCGFTETRTLPLEEHDPNAQNVCRVCRKVIFDDSASLVELGVVCDAWYGSGKDANFVWDLKYWNGKIYRAAGDYDKNSGSTTILAYNIANQVWENTDTVADEAVHGFVEIGGTLVAPGIDAREGWEYGNFYVLQGDGKWRQIRNLKNGVHNFDMIECDGKIFAGLGTETTGKTVAMSDNGGQSFSFVPLYKDGKLMDLSGYKSSRTYEFVAYNNTVYALVRFTMGFGGEWAVFRYEDGKMHYLTNGYKLLGTSTSRKYFSGEFEFNGACYVAGGGLIKVTDFADQENWKTIPMPGGETIVDAIVRDGVIYALGNAQNRNPSNHNVESYRAVIYKSTTGEEGSFEEVLSFDHPSKAQSLEWDGEHFYIGTSISLDTTKVGMVLRATPEK